MSRTQTGLNFVKRIVAGRLWGSSPMAVVDIGASGGISDRWSLFGERLVAIGFDALATEAERLNALETRIDVRYEVARVGCREYDRLFPPELRSDSTATLATSPFTRSSAFAAQPVDQMNFDRDVLNAGAEARYTRRFVTLDEYFATVRLRPNVLRIETVGSELEVLLGAKDFLSSADLLCVHSTVQFHGQVHDCANTFSNVDRFVRERGFSLFDLQPARYSRAALPGPFAIGYPAQTLSGQVHWGEAVYFRDLGHPSYQDAFAVEPTRERLLKLCCLFAMYGLDDCAAELLASSPALADWPDRAELLNVLTPRHFDDATYTDYIARFNANPSAWLPKSLAGQSKPGVGAEFDDELMAVGDRRTVLARNERLHAQVLELTHRVAGLKKLLRKLRDRYERSEHKVKKLRNERLQLKEQKRNQVADSGGHGRPLADFVSRLRAGFLK